MKPTPIPLHPPQVWSNPIHFLAFGFGAGLAKKAPGTWGTVAAIPVYLLCTLLPLPAYLGVVVLLAALGIWLCQVTANDMGVHDHPGIVWDEIVGFLITMSAAPIGWLNILLGFLLFRLFDIWKPWPIYLLDRHVHDGFGIMIDDIVAGVYAWGVLQLMLYFWS